MEDNFVCLECSKTYSFRRNLRAHITKCHPSKLEELAPALITVPKYTCNDCEKVFSKQSLLRAHERTEHGKSYTPKLIEGGKCYNHKKCPLCDFTSTKTELLKHFGKVHDKCVVTENLQFPSFQEFTVWKKAIETETRCSFIVERGAQKRNSDTHYFFVCHRSGVYIPEGSGIRHLKLQGSKKINGFCPASITVIETDGKCCVQYLKTHVGHKNEIGHMFLSKEDRNYLASKIAAGIPFERILGEIRDSMAGDQTRMHLLTRHDLHNIVFQFSLSSVRHTDTSIKLNMGKHIHSVCQYRKNKKCDDCNDSVGDLCIDHDSVDDLCIDHDDDELTEQNTISSELGKNAPSSSKTLMEKVQNMNENILFMTRSIKTDTEYHAIKRLVDTMQWTLNAVRAQDGRFSELEIAGPSNKNIIPQGVTKEKKIYVPQGHLLSIKKGERKKKNRTPKTCVNPQRKNSKSALQLLNVGECNHNTDTRPVSQQHNIED